MGDCIFCDIAEGKLKSDIVFENENVVAFKDVNPQAPVHILVISRKHIPTLSDLEAEDEELVGEIFRVIKSLADEHGIAEQGYRVVSNCKESAGQSVFHIHFHLLGGRDFGWPPG